jgi:hypothetical protein
VVNTVPELMHLITDFLHADFHTLFHTIKMHYKFTTEQFKAEVERIESEMRETGCEAMGVKVVVFVDEFNATSILGVVKEVLMDHSLDGRPLSPSLLWVGAMNPHNASSLSSFSLSSVASSSTPLKASFGITTDPHQPLSASASLPEFMVRAVPPSLDFLTLHFLPYTAQQEEVYLKCLLQFVEDEKRRTVMRKLIAEAQEFVRAAHITRVKVSIRGIFKKEEKERKDRR